MMKRVDAIELLSATKGETGISVTTMRSIPDWYDTGVATERHIDNIGCMGGAAPIALGLALAQPDRQVMVIDGDGSLLMQLGVLASIAEAAPKNLYHVVARQRRLRDLRPAADARRGQARLRCHRARRRLRAGL